MKYGMKKARVWYMFMLAFMIFVSCDKLKDKLFEAFTTGMTDVNFTVPVVTNTAAEGKIETLPIFINVDSIIRANTGGLFSLNSVSTIMVETADLTINNPDASNNLANFESGLLLFNTFNPQTNDWNTPMGVGREDIKDNYATSLSFALIPDVNLKEHLRATKVIYLYGYKARRVTTKPLNCTIRMKLKIE